MSSAMAGVFTYLVTNIRTAVNAIDATAVVVDGPINPDEDPPPPAPLVFIGAASPVDSTATDGSRMYVNLGQMSADEEFTIPCYIDSAVGGSNDQAACRNAALTLLDAIIHLVASDMTLGGLLLAGRVAQVQDIQIVQTATDEEAADGRRCLIPFTVHCANHYTP